MEKNKINIIPYSDDYDDDNIPGIDLPGRTDVIPEIDLSTKTNVIPEIDLSTKTNVIPDEVPRRDGPGGE